MSSEETGIYDTRFCTLIDRAAIGGFEFMYGGIPYVFAKDQVEMPVAQSVAQFVLGLNDQTHVWTTDGERVNRLAVRGASKDLLAALGGASVEDETPIEIDRHRNALGQTFPRATTEASARRMQGGQREHQGGAGASRLMAAVAPQGV